MFNIVSYVIKINQDIIKIDYYINIKEVRKYVIYEVLESRKSIGKTKRYDRLFE